MKYKCGCTAAGDNVANYCPIHGDAIDRSTDLLSLRSPFGAMMWSGQCNSVPAFILSYYPGWHKLWCFTDGEWKLIYKADGAPALIKRLIADNMKLEPIWR